MSITYTDGLALSKGDGPFITVNVRLQNRSAETWRQADAFRVGCQTIDAATNLFIEDGPRLALPQDVAPGGTAEVRFEIRLPESDGQYRVFVSPMREDRFWYYDRGWPIFLVEAAVAGGRASVIRSRVTTRQSVRAGIALRSVKRAFVYPFLSIGRNWSLVRSMTRRDILSRYRGSFGGAFWTLLNPLLLMLTYFFVFGIVLRARFAADPSPFGFALYFLAGMLPWLAFSEAAGRAPFVMLEHRNFVKKLVFPLEILPVNLVVAGLVTQAFALAVFVALLAAARGAVPPTILWLPVLLVPQVMFTLGLCWFLAALGVYFRDLGQFSGFLLTLWFFLTPICYPEASLPAAAVGVLSKNPVFVLVRGYRAILLEGIAPSFAPLWKLWLVSAAVLVLGHAWFYKLRKSFADVI